MSGGLIANKLPLICGGDDKDRCYLIGQGDDIRATTSGIRAFSASLVIEDKLWITGGSDVYQKTVHQSTEFIEIDIHSSGQNYHGFSSKGPDLPIALYYHSITQLNKSAAMIIGGTNEYGTDIQEEKTYIFDLENFNWKRGPDLQKGRSRHASALLTDSVTNIQYIVVAGDNPEDTVEMLQLPSDGKEWFYGKC